jgi:nucleobase:cation symporter-1, NCS1 family
MGWFAVNSISGAYALATLFGFSAKLALAIVIVVQVLVAFFGHNLIQLFERVAFPVLLVVFVIAAVSTFGHADLATPGTGGIPTSGAFIITLAAAFGYAAGWNPYASDYTRYLAPETRRLPVALCAGLGVFVSCVFLEVAGSAVVTAGKDAVDPSSYTDLLPTWIGKLVLLAICLGAVAANAINIYSGSISFMALGVRLPTHAARAAVALVFGVIGLFVAFGGLHNAGSTYENFLLIISYWIGPWLGVVFVDRVLRRGSYFQALLGDKRYLNWAGPISMAVAMVLSIWLFSDQTKYVGLIPKHHPAFGDLTFEVGFAIAAVLYVLIYSATRQGEVSAALELEDEAQVAGEGTPTTVAT